MSGGSQNYVSKDLAVQLLKELHVDSDSRDSAIRTFYSLDRELALKVLSELLKHSDENIRGDAAEMLWRLDQNQTLPVVLDLLRDPVTAVRWNTCGLLLDFGDDRATEELANVLLNDSDPSVRLIAADALGRVGGQRAI